MLASASGQPEREVAPSSQEVSQIISTNLRVNTARSKGMRARRAGRKAYSLPNFPGFASEQGGGGAAWRVVRSGAPPTRAGGFEHDAPLRSFAQTPLATGAGPEVDQNEPFESGMWSQGTGCAPTPTPRARCASGSNRILASPRACIPWLYLRSGGAFLCQNFLSPEPEPGMVRLPQSYQCGPFPLLDRRRGAVYVGDPGSTGRGEPCAMGSRLHREWRLLKAVRLVEDSSPGKFWD